MCDVEQIVCVILAGGQGKRMASSDLHKVCFPIAGRPAIVRAIDAYKQAGLRRFLVVVGQLAGQVVATVARAHPEVTFVFQAEPRGTGHAALVAADALASQGYSGAVMVTMGDKVVHRRAPRSLLKHFAERRPDALLSVLPKTPESAAGRVVTDKKGEVLGIVESPDIKRAAASKERLCVGGRVFSAAEVEKNSSVVNVSMYMFDFDVLNRSLGELSPANAQGELYLTDCIELIARRGSVETMLVSDADDLMAFNTPADLLAIEEVIRRRERGSQAATESKHEPDSRILKTAREWRSVLDSFPPAARAEFRQIYGDSSAVLADRCRAMSQLVAAFIDRHGPDRRMVLCRAPGRINLLGRHVDHRGGFVNVMAINREVLLAAAPRTDDVVRLANLQTKQFPDREFRIFDLLGESSWSDWMDFLASSTVTRVLQAAPGDWSHYVRAPLLRLQYEHRQTQLRGMDCMVSGNIPMGSGLSSSSALVVAFAEAAVALNGLDVTMSDFVDLCGEGEWFVGSRGGSADHAAIRTGQVGRISRIGFFPFRLVDEVNFPPELRVVIAHSGTQAVKSTGARDIFNQRVACYAFAEMLLRRHWPAAAAMQHLRDLTPDRLKLGPAHIYRALMHLPERPSRRQLRQMLPERQHTRLDEIFASHANLGGYDLRGVALYGISECMRSERFAAILEAGDLAQVGQFMRASHDGDRRFRHDQNGRCRRHLVKTNDGTLRRLAAANASLTDQPGRYACSTEAIDSLVDIACATPGIVGAQIAGAGLGGCMMILAQTDAVDGLTRRLEEQFYAPRALPCEVHVCTPVSGAGMLAVDG